jgi:hypothetical protein
MEEKKMTRVTGVVLRQREYWLGWPGTAYPVNKYEKEYPQRSIELGKEAGMEVSFADTVYDEAGVEKFLEKIKSDPPDGLLLITFSMPMWTLIDKIIEAGLPTVVFAYIGMAFTGHIVNRSRQKGVYIISSTDVDSIKTGLKMIDTKVKLTQERVLVLKGTSEETEDTVVKNLGIKVRTVGRQKIVNAYKRVEVTDEIKEIAAKYENRAQKIVEPTSEDLINAARMYVACKKLMAEYDATAITVDCLGFIGARLTDMTPCLAFSKLNDERISAACEADFDAVMTMILLKHMFDKPSFMNDPVPETVKNTLIVAHCTSPTKLYGYETESEPFALRSHSESNIGVSPQVLWKEGQKVTLARFQGPAKMLIGAGTVVGNIDTPPAGGCRTSFEVKMDDVEDVRDVKGFHQLLMYGDHARELKYLCQMLGVEPAKM